VPSPRVPSSLALMRRPRNGRSTSSRAASPSYEACCRVLYTVYTRVVSLWRYGVEVWCVIWRVCACALPRPAADVRSELCKVNMPAASTLRFRIPARNHSTSQKNGGGGGMMSIEEEVSMISRGMTDSPEIRLRVSSYDRDEMISYAIKHRARYHVRVRYRTALAAIYLALRRCRSHDISHRGDIVAAISG